MKTRPIRPLQRIISRLMFTHQLVASLLVAVMMLTSYYLSWQNSLAQQRQLNTLLAQEIGKYYTSASQVLKASALMPETQQSLDAIIAGYQTFDVLYRIDAQARLAGAAPRDPRTPLGIDMSMQPFYQEGLHGLSISDMFISSRTGNPTVYLSLPVGGGGLLVGELSLSGLEESISRSNLSETGELFILEDSGDLLAYPDYRLVREQTNIRQLGIDMARLRSRSTNFYRFQGQWVFSYITPIPRTPWFAVTQMPLAELIRPYLLPSLGGLLLALALFGLSYRREREAVLQQVVAPLGQINREVKHLAEGHYEPREVHTPRASDYLEIAGIAESFERMKQAIMAREASLQASEERLRYAMEATNDGLWDWDISSGRVDFNLGYLKIMEYEGDEHPTDVRTWSDALHPDDRERVLRINQECIDNLRETFEVEYRLAAKSGRWKWIMARGKAVARDSQGRALRLVGTHVDITERKRAEEAVRRMADELERRVAERTASLEAANQELESFAYSVSHDLRAPLRGIDGWSMALLEDYQDCLDEEGRGYLRRVRGEAQYMGRLIDELLDLSRAALVGLDRRQIDLSTLALVLVDRQREEQAGRPVEWVIQPELSARVDPGLVEIALTNLFQNAVKFTEKTALPRVEFGMKMEGARRIFFVADNGAGFDMNYARNLFSPFQRLHKTSQFAGTGIGLSIVKRVIQRHEGRIWAEGQVGKGAVFYFTLEGTE